MTDDDVSVTDRLRQLAEVTMVDLEAELEQMKFMPTQELKQLLDPADDLLASFGDDLPDDESD